MPTIDYFLSGNHDRARELFAQALQTEGFAIAPQPNGSWNVTRGSAALTFWFGAFAGKRQQRLVFTAGFFEHEGSLVARVFRESGGGAMAGGIGIVRSNRAFAEVDQAIGQTMMNAGILTNVVRN